MKGVAPSIRKNWNYIKHSSWRLYGSSFCKSRQTYPSSTSWSVNEKCIGWVSQLKTAGTQKVFPLPPCRGAPPPNTPFPKIKECYWTALGGGKLGGKTFCSTLQLSRSFKMLSWFYSGGFSGTSFVWENCFSRTGTASACAQSARRQRPCCRLLQLYIYSPLIKRFYKCRSGRASAVRALPPLSVPMILPAPEADLPKVMAASRPWVWSKTASSEFHLPK